MMGRVRSSRSLSGGMEVAHRGVAKRLQPMTCTGLDIRVRSLKSILVLPYLRRPTAVVTSKGNALKSNKTLKRGAEADLRGASQIGCDEGDCSRAA